MQCYDATLRNSKQLPNKSGQCVYPYCNSKYFTAYQVSPFSQIQQVTENYAGPTKGGFPLYQTGYKWNNSALSMGDPYNCLSYNASSKW